VYELAGITDLILTTAGRPARGHKGNVRANLVRHLPAVRLLLRAHLWFPHRLLRRHGHPHRAHLPLGAHASLQAPLITTVRSCVHQTNIRVHAAGFSCVAGFFPGYYVFFCPNPTSVDRSTVTVLNELYKDDSNYCIQYPQQKYCTGLAHGNVLGRCPAPRWSSEATVGRMSIFRAGPFHCSRSPLSLPFALPALSHPLLARRERPAAPRLRPPAGPPAPRPELTRRRSRINRLADHSNLTSTSDSILTSSRST
jgi:hypothetical protein